MSRRRDPNTLDLLAWEPPQVAVGYGEEVTGRGPLENRIARVIRETLDNARDHAGLSRDEIANRLSEFLGRRISKDLLDKWTSPAATANRIPLDAFLGLAKITGDTNLIGFVASQFGLAAVPEKYAGLIELHLIEEREAELSARKQALQAQWRARR